MTYHQVCLVGFKRSLLKPAFAMARSFVRSWNELYRMIGYAAPEDPELARAAIITNFVSSHLNGLLDTDDFYVNINLHIHLSAISIPHFGDVKRRLAEVLPPVVVAALSIEVLQIPARQVPRGPGLDPHHLAIEQ